MNREQLIEELKHIEDIVPDEYDGSYELVREIVRSYANVDDHTSFNTNDLNAIYAMAIGTWKINIEKKKEYIQNSNLPHSEIDRLYFLLDSLWKKACRQEYQHWHEMGNQVSIGMFGNGFHKCKTSQEDASIFLSGLVNVFLDRNEEDAFNAIEEVFKQDIKGIGTGSASMLLHCLKPDVFPILNYNQGINNIYEFLGIHLDDPQSLKNYIHNCKKIRDYRNANFTFKNYRIFDLATSKTGDVYWPSKEEYDPAINISQWLELLHNQEIFSLDDLSLLAAFYIDNPCSYKHIDSKFDGYMNESSKALIDQLTKRIYQKAGCPLAKKKDGTDLYWPILFTGKHENDAFIYQLREELYAALTELKIPEHLWNNDRQHWVYSNNFIDQEELFDTNVIEIGIADESDKLSYLSNRMKIGDIIYIIIHQKAVIAKGIVISDYYIDADHPDYKNKRKIFVTDIGALKKNYIQKDNFQLLLIEKEEYIQKFESTLKEEEKMEKSLFHHNLILFGPPGTGKTYNTINYAVAIIENKPLEEIQKEEYGEVKKRYDVYVENNQIAFTTFHQSYGYEDFIEGIKPITKEGHISYEIQDGIFKEFVKKSNQHLRYVFIIDEINRGNISKIFGELITLLEETKRKGTPEALSAILPYSKEKFSIPDHIFLLGTMNTADRSIALMDSALRRRFHFLEIMPDPSLLKGISIEGLNIERMLTVINQRITYLYDREHTIGHAFFIPLISEPTLENLSDIFRNKIIPLLQEYFYDDYSKIQLVLGDNGKELRYQFIQSEEIDLEKIFYGDLDDMDLPDKSYKINQNAFKYIESYRKIIF